MTKRVSCSSIFNQGCHDAVQADMMLYGHVLLRRKVYCGSAVMLELPAGRQPKDVESPLMRCP